MALLHLNQFQTHLLLTFTGRRRVHVWSRGIWTTWPQLYEPRNQPEKGVWAHGKCSHTDSMWKVNWVYYLHFLLNMSHIVSQHRGELVNWLKCYHGILLQCHANISEMSELHNRQHTLAFTPSSGKMDSFGLGGNGQLGTRSTCNRKSPAPVKGPWAASSAPTETGETH